MQYLGKMLHQPSRCKCKHAKSISGLIWEGHIETDIYAKMLLRELNGCCHFKAIYLPPLDDEFCIKIQKKVQSLKIG